MRAMQARLVERLVTYTIEVNGQIVLVEHVPARVNEETGERFFAPETVERLQEIIWNRSRPDRIVETPVLEFGAQGPREFGSARGLIHMAEDFDAPLEDFQEYM